MTPPSVTLCDKTFPGYLAMYFVLAMCAQFNCARHNHATIKPWQHSRRVLREVLFRALQKGSLKVFLFLYAQDTNFNHALRHCKVVSSGSADITYHCKSTLINHFVSFDPLNYNYALCFHNCMYVVNNFNLQEDY